MTRVIVSIGGNKETHVEAIIPQLVEDGAVRAFFTVVVGFVYFVIALGFLAFAASEM